MSLLTYRPNKAGSKPQRKYDVEENVTFVGVGVGTFLSVGCRGTSQYFPTLLYLTLIKLQGVQTAVSAHRFQQYCGAGGAEIILDLEPEPKEKTHFYLHWLVLLVQIWFKWQYMAGAGAEARIKLRDKGGDGAENK